MLYQNYKVYVIILLLFPVVAKGCKIKNVCGYCDFQMVQIYFVLVLVKNRVKLFANYHCHWFAWEKELKYIFLNPGRESEHEREHERSL